MADTMKYIRPTLTHSMTSQDVVFHRGQFNLRPAAHRRLRRRGHVRSGYAQRLFSLLRGFFVRLAIYW